MNSVKKIIIILLALWSLSTLESFGQTVDEFELDIQDNQPNFVFNTIADYENGVTYPGAVRFSVKAKKKDDWKIFVKATGAAFTNGENSMPLSTLKIKVQGFAECPLTTLDQQIAYGVPHNAEYEVINYLIDYTLAAPQYNYNPGTYTCDMLYTVTVR